MTASASRDGSVSRMTMSRGLSFGGDGPNIEEFEWAEDLPPFHPEGARVSLTGELWIERYLPADSLPQMVVFDQEALLKGAVELPPGRKLIGFGAGPDGEERIYLVRTDEYDLKWLERYRVVR